MALSLTSRPISGASNWNAAGNPIVYKFLSTGHGALVNYRIEIECFRASDNSSLSEGIKFRFTPHPTTGITIADISAIVKSFLSADWTNPVGANVAEAGTSLKFYIKYQELYTGSAVAVVDDVANPVFAVFAAMQIGSANGGNMLEHFPADNTRRFLFPFGITDLVMWRAWPFSASFIYPASIGNLFELKSEYDVEGNLLVLQGSLIQSSQQDEVNRIPTLPTFDETTRIEVQIGNGPAQPAGYITSVTIPDNSFVQGITPGFWVNAGSGIAWSGGGGQILSSLSTGQTTRIAQITPGQQLGNRFLKIDLTILVLVATTFRVNIYLNLSNVAISGIIASTPGVDQVITLYVFSPITGATDIGFTVQQLSGGAASTYAVKQIDVTEGYLVPVLATLPVEVRDADEPIPALSAIAGKNPIHLEWKNSTGGDAHWNFDNYHEYVYTYNNGRKAKRIRLFATNVTPLQWEYLNELNSVGEVYSPNIVELTSSVNATSKRIGQQVYMLSQDGATKTGVIVMPTSDRVLAQNVRTSIQIEIELPRIFNV